VSEAERHIKEEKENYADTRVRQAHLSIAETICEATAHAADDLDLRGIALFTESGATARQLSKYHPTSPIFALSPIEVTINRLNLLWGTTPVRCPKVNSTEALVDVAESLLEQYGYVRKNEVIAIVAGTRTKSGSTNFLRLHVLGEQKEGVRFLAPPHAETIPAPEPAGEGAKGKRGRKTPLRQYPSPNPPRISNP
jgi:pyruvate kinase